MTSLPCIIFSFFLLIIMFCVIDKSQKRTCLDITVLRYSVINLLFLAVVIVTENYTLVCRKLSSVNYRMRRTKVYKVF